MRSHELSHFTQLDDFLQSLMGITRSNAAPDRKSARSFFEAMSSAILGSPAAGSDYHTVRRVTLREKGSELLGCGYG